MNDIKPNVTGYIEIILRLAGATFLVPIILYTEWIVFIPVPFYVLVTVMSGYDPLAAFLVNRFIRKARQTTHVRYRKITKVATPSNTHNSRMRYAHK
ncbi:hypothetical protein [Spirosoma flavus]